MNDSKLVNAAIPVGSGGFLMWISNLDWSTLSYMVGISVAVLGLIVSVYFQYRRDRRDEEVHRVTIESIQKRGVSVTDED